MFLTALTHRLRSPLAATGLVVLLVGGGVLGLRSLGTLESFELAAYDWYMRLRPFEPGQDSRILLVTVTEADIQEQKGWPLSDAVVAKTLGALARYGPRAIGLDMYRDLPVPPGGDRLKRALADPRVVVVTKFAEGSSAGVPPPAVLKGTEQVGFNDIVVDPGGTIRRGLLFLDDGETVLHAFALRLALLYLRPEGVTPQPDPGDPRLVRLGRTTIRPLEPNDGPYVETDARGYQFLLDFKGGRAPFRSVTLTELLSGTIDPAVIKDKIVLIGITADSVKDFFHTPFSRGLQANQQTPGVAIHAQIASQLLRMALGEASPMATTSEWQEVLWILLWGGMGGLIGLRLRSPWRFSLAGGGGVLALGLVDFAAFLGHWWLPLVPPALAYLVSAAVVTAYMSYQEMAQRAVLMKLFSRHVSKEVAETIWHQREQFLDGGRPRPQRLIATALFTDLTGFTTVSEKFSPEQLMEWLNEYMDAMAQEVSRHGGVIRQYAGDSIVVLFGVPVARQGHEELCRDAANAVNCALAMQAALLDLNRRWRAAGTPVTGMRVGIFTGPVVAGTLGSAERSEYVTVGDTMNTASRLESFNKEIFPPDPDTHPCRILIGEPTLGYLGGQFETEWVGDVNLKGKEHPVGIYRVLGRIGARPEALSQGGRR